MKQTHFKYAIVVCCVVSISCGQSTSVTNKPVVDTTAAIQTPADTTEMQQVIIPGAQLGHIMLGLNADSIETLLGKPDSSDAAMGKAWLTWKGKETKQTKLQVYTTYKDTSMRERTVQQIYTTSPHFKTNTGLHVGSELAVIKTGFPDLKKTAVYTESGTPVELYDAIAEGIAFEIKRSVCAGIIIHKKEQRADAVYIMLHPNMKRL